MVLIQTIGSIFHETSITEVKIQHFTQSGTKSVPCYSPFVALMIRKDQSRKLSMGFIWSKNVILIKTSTVRVVSLLKKNVNIKGTFDS